MNARRLGKVSESGLISYAQAREDILLHRALHHVHHSKGFYIDVGGYDPHLDSVTKHFYQHGWRGINVEPGRHLFPSFVRDRPRDVNLNVAVTDEPGEVVFYEIDNGQLGTLEKRFADMHAEAGQSGRSYTVSAMTLAQICEKHVTGNIHFLKIDVEGHEAGVVRGMDFTRFRPWILVIESTVPNNLHIPTYHEWEERVLGAGYDFVYTDVLNRYYVAQEHPTLKPHFAVPADDYVYDRVRREYEHRIRELERKLEDAIGLQPA
jgi:FkbM family methyltransferase